MMGIISLEKRERTTGRLDRAVLESRGHRWRTLPPDAQHGGLWLLVTTPTRRAVAIAVTMAAVADPSLMVLIRNAAPGVPVTLLAPGDLNDTVGRRLRDAGIHLVSAVAAIGARPEEHN